MMVLQATTHFEIKEITNKKERNSTLDEIKRWKLLTQKRLSTIPGNVKAQDADEVGSAILRDLSNFSSHMRLFLAVGENKTVEGIAIVQFKKEGAQLLQLATHPKNLACTPENCVAVKGVGTALVRHLIQSVQQDPAISKKTIKLDSLPSAIGFYEKFGFRQCAHAGPEKTRLTKMAATF